MLIFEENVSLSQYSNFKIGGPARYFFVAKTIGELRDALARAAARNLRIFILGGGTNLLIRDAGFGGLVLVPGFPELKREENVITAGAGVLMSELLDFAARENLSGLEWAGGLPGMVGGAVRGNAGAFGGEMKDSVVKVKSAVVSGGEPVERDAAACHFGYRTSVYKELGGQEIITEVALALFAGAERKILEKVREKIRYRQEHHPLEYPNIGSIFKNVPVERFCRESGMTPGAVREKFPVKDDPLPLVPAAYLISEVGLKEMSRGGALISPKHPNFIVNTGTATAADVEFLIAEAKKRVADRYRVTLEEEIQRVP